MRVHCLLLALTVGAVPAAARAAGGAPANQELIYAGEATGILGRPVHDPNDEVVGRIVDVLVDDQGQPRAAVIDIGGFMGVGNRRIAVAWRAMHFLPVQQHPVKIDLTMDQIKSTPEYHEGTKAPSVPLTMAAPPSPPGMPASGK